MKVPVVSLAFAALALCGRGYAGPCIPQSSAPTTVVSSTTDATASTSTATSTVTDSSSAESSSTELSFTFTDISSLTEVFIMSTILFTELTTFVASTTTTTIKSGSINSNPAFSRSGSRSAFFTIVVCSQRGRVAQTLDLVPGKTYGLSYWWLLNKGQPAADWGCYTTVIVSNSAGQTVVYKDHRIVAPLPLNTWTENQLSFESTGPNSKLQIYAFCNARTGPGGVNIVIDDITLKERASS
ncbi:hypothetical protein NCS56_01215300 [Fusarium sp. Ph1]|nr:hypothetical protein NCS56_01215300 [Fusarium sp. Ph1]